MDIYFCDECSARVTAADLRRGFGIRKADVVVCGSCVEEGRGGEHLAPAKAQPVLVGANALDEARDRARTVPEDGPAQGFFENVSPEEDTDPLNQAVPREESAVNDDLGAMASGLAALSPQDQRSDDGLDDLEDAGDVQAKTDEIAPVPEQRDELFDDDSAAAAPAPVADKPALAIADGMLAGLSDDDEASDEPESGAAPLDLDVADAGIDLAGDSEPEADETAQDEQADEVADAKGADEGTDKLSDSSSSTDDLEPTDLALEGDSDDESADDGSGKAETEEVPAASGRSKAKEKGKGKGKSTTKRKSSTSKRKNASSSSSRKPSTSTRVNKAAKPSTRRSGSKTLSTKRVRSVKKNNSSLVYGVSFVTITILLIAIYMVAGQGGGSIDGGQRVIDPTGDLRSMIDRVEDQAVAAIRAKDEQQLLAAQEALNATQLQVYEWQDEAEAQGKTEEEMGRILRAIHYDRLQAVGLEIRNELMKIEGYKL
ncbi:MAG: hypothetical protein PF961_21165 [Planctomycetota bacterium]|jgi:hypothetical protein|nr:hypothetical protein [Planctomycetota bacterium]